MATSRGRGRSLQAVWLFARDSSGRDASLLVFCVTMRFDRVQIASVAHADATHRVTSVELEERLRPTLSAMKAPSGMIEGLTGIRARRWWDEGFQPSDAATLAAEKALETAGVDRDKIGILINTSVCRDFIEPSVACLVHGNLGLPSDCMNFDLGNACLGFLNGMEIVGNMIERGQIDYGLVVDGESSRFVVEKTIERLNAIAQSNGMFRDNFATLTLGSGGAAMVLGRDDLVQSGHVFRGGVTLASTEHNHLCRGQVDGMITDSQGLMVAGIELAARTFENARQELGWDDGALDELVLHQVSRSHTDKLAGTLGLDHSKILAIYPEFGNVGPASVPIVLSKAQEMGRIQSGSRIALMGIGSGLNCSMAEIVW